MIRLALALGLSLPALPACNACKVNNPHKGDPLNPSIEEISVGPAVQGTGADVAVDVQVPGYKDLWARDVTTKYRLLEGKWQPGPELDSNEVSLFTGTLPPLSYGTYELCVDVPLHRKPSIEAPPPVVVDTLRDHVEFSVGPGGACYEFSDEAEGVQGWTFAGVFDAQTGEPTAHLNGVDPLMIWWNGSLYVLPNLSGSGAAATDEWFFDYTSPDLSSSFAWQQVKELVVRMSAPTALTLEPLLHYELPDGLVQVVSAGTAELSGTIEEVFPTEHPAGTVLTRVDLRIRGQYAPTASNEMSVRLHMLCPLGPEQFVVFPPPIVVVPVGD